MRDFALPRRPARRRAPPTGEPGARRHPAAGPLPAPGRALGGSARRRPRPSRRPRARRSRPPHRPTARGGPGGVADAGADAHLRERAPGGRPRRPAVRLHPATQRPALRGPDAAGGGRAGPQRLRRHVHHETRPERAISTSTPYADAGVGPSTSSWPLLPVRGHFTDPLREQALLLSQSNDCPGTEVCTYTLLLRQPATGGPTVPPGSARCRYRWGAR